MTNLDLTNTNDEIEKLRNHLDELIYERDNLLYIVCENIRAQYIILFGGKEYRIIKLQMDYQKLKAKLSRIQAKINRKEVIDRAFLEKIEIEIEKEYEDYKKILEEKSAEINWATRVITSEKLKGEDLREFKRMYKEIVKHLHPDLNPHISEEDLTLFNKAVEAYKNGWYEFIEVYYYMVVDKEIGFDFDNEAAEIARLKELIKQLEASIGLIKDSFPYNKKDLIEDEAEILAYNKKLDILIDDYVAEIRRLGDTVMEMTKDV